jgi:hypothetical protein
MRLVRKLTGEILRGGRNRTRISDPVRVNHSNCRGYERNENEQKMTVCGSMPRWTFPASANYEWPHFEETNTGHSASLYQVTQLEMNQHLT